MGAWPGASHSTLQDHTLCVLSFLENSRALELQPRFDEIGGHPQLARPLVRTNTLAYGRAQFQAQVQALAHAIIGVMLILTYFLPALIFLSKDAIAGRRPRFEPLPVCSDCVSPDDIIAPGIGIDLTTSYATVAVRFHDGSIEALAKVGLSSA